MRQTFSAGLRSRLGFATARSFSRFANRAMTFSTRQLQHAFRRAHQFGQGNWSKATGEAFRRAIEAHIRNANTFVRQGFNRGERVTHFHNPQTGLNVIRDAGGNFWSAWRLNPSQVWHLLRTGRLGGG